MKIELKYSVIFSLFSNHNTMFEIQQVGGWKIFKTISTHTIPLVRQFKPHPSVEPSHDRAQHNTGTLINARCLVQSSIAV